QANPNFVRRNRPWRSEIREIRFFAWNGAAGVDLAKDLGQPVPHLVLGAAHEHMQALNKLGYAELSKPSSRRVYILALNHRVPALANASLRRAIAHALQRDAILDEVFRGRDKDKGSKLARSVNGPFPPDAWACCPPPRVPPDLHKAESAHSLAKNVAADVGAVQLTLKYPAHVP